MAKIYDMTKGSIFKNLLVVALPVLLTSISQMAYNLTDMFWIGQVDSIGLIEQNAISGIGTAGYVTWFAFGLILIAKIGTSVKVSHAVGSKRHDLIESYATNGITLALILGLIFSLIVFFFKESIIGIFNIDEIEVVEMALSYLSIVGSFLFLQFVTSGFAAINEGLGKTSLNFMVLVVGLILNIGLDPLFILTFEMGVAGAALATVIAQFITLMIFIIIYIVNRKKVWTFHLSNVNPILMKDIVRIGVFAGFQSMFFTAISIVIARMIFVYGGQVMAAQRIGSQIEQLTWMIAGGFQTALTVFVGQNFGAKQTSRIKRGTVMLSYILIPYALIIGMILYFFAEPLIRIFIDDPQTIAFGKQYLEIISIAQVFMMLEGIGTGFFNGVGKSIVPSIVGIVGNLLRLPGAKLLSYHYGYIGIWWTLNISDILKGTVMMIATIILLINIKSLLLTSKKNKTKIIEI
jgi:putative MATE family efflux protein